MREHPVRVRDKVVARCLLPNTSGSSALTRIDALTEGSVMGEHSVRVKEEYGEEKGQRGSLQVSITSSPDAYFLLFLGCQL